MATASELFSEARCYLCLGMSVAQALKLAFLRRWLLVLDPAADTSPSALTAQACLICASGGSIAEMLEIALLSLISERSEIDAIVDDFAARAGISDQTQLDALTDLVASARANGWWDLCDLIYPFVGGTAAAHAENLKSSSFTITWVGGVTHDANGVTGNGTDGHGTTAYFPNSSGTIQLNSIHASAYVRTVLTGGRYFVGSHDAVGNGASFAATNTNNRRGGRMNDATDTIFTNAVGINLSALARTDSASKRRYRYWDGLTPGTTQQQIIAVNSVGISTAALYVLARNNNGVADLFTDANLAFITVGSGITFDQFLIMQSDIQTFQTALGRQV